MIAGMTGRTMTPSSIVASYCSGSLLSVTITKLETGSGFLIQTRKTGSLAVTDFSINVVANLPATLVNLKTLWARQLLKDGIESQARIPKLISLYRSYFNL